MFYRTCFILFVAVFANLSCSCSLGNITPLVDNLNYTFFITPRYNMVQEDVPKAVIANAKLINFPACAAVDKHYYLGTFLKANYFQAGAFCRYHGMELATIETQQHQNILVQYINTMGFGNEFFWTSGNDLGEEGKYVWASSGQKITFKNFLPGQPDNANAKEHCLELRNGGLWNDMVCDVKQFFVCQF